METVASPQMVHIQNYAHHHLVNSISSTTSSLASSSSSSGIGAHGDSNSSFGLDNSSQTNLIVNYLPQTMTECEMKTLFEQIDHVERCKLIKNRANQSLCYGFVKYSKPESAERAIKSLNGLKLENKILKVSFARPSCESIKGANLYICGFPRHWSTQDLENYFSQCGRIITSRILVDSATGLSKGVGFVRFDRRNEAEMAIERLNGRIPTCSQNSSANEPITVRYAKYWNSPDDPPVQLSNLPANYSIQLSDPPYEFKNIQPIGAIFTDTAQNIPAIATEVTPIKTPTTGQTFYPAILPNIGWRVFVRNLPPETQETLLWELFGPFGAVLNVRLIRNFPSYTCKGQGYVTMAVLEEANKAVHSLDGYSIGGRVLQVYLTTNNEFF